ncbi:VOC family protein [uncultured Mitsuokella sp.]|uniref:VOC family protein n=1 Tax=uncultured Mitsuokella sp. TaxID=453120 RepID=UPI0025D26C63|nr:VOC family protein [uncultured Mitsuokella sp.]
MSLIKGLHHAALKCSCQAEFQEAIHFYKEVLGLPVKRSWGEGDDAGIMFDTGAGLIEIFAKGGDNHEEGSVRHFALATDDTDACVKTIRDAGYKITVEPTSMTIPAEQDFPVRIAFAIGPCGETIELFKEC